MVHRLIPVLIAAVLVLAGVLSRAYCCPRVGSVIIVVGLLLVFIVDLVKYARAGRLDEAE